MSGLGRYQVLAVVLAVLCLLPAHLDAQSTSTDSPHRRHFPRLTQGDITEISEIINNLIESNVIEDGTHPYIAGFVRLIFHDCVGVSCDGCVNLEYGPNAGLAPYIDVLNRTYYKPEHKLFKRMSQADLWALAGIIAAGRGAAKGGEPLSTVFRYGRIDCSTSPDTNAEDVYPNANGGARETLDYWKDYFGFTYPETTALLGAHSLGRCHRNASGFDGPWTTDKDSLDNAYFRDIANAELGWRQEKLDSSHVQWVQSVGTDNMMLNSDMALFKDLRPDTEDPAGQFSHCTYAQCGYSPSAAHVLAYAKDNALFVRQFSSVFQKMIEHGYTTRAAGRDLYEPVPGEAYEGMPRAPKREVWERAGARARPYAPEGGVMEVEEGPRTAGQVARLQAEDVARRARDDRNREELERRNPLRRTVTTVQQEVEELVPPPRRGLAHPTHAIRQHGAASQALIRLQRSLWPSAQDEDEAPGEDRFASMDRRIEGAR